MNVKKALSSEELRTHWKRLSAQTSLCSAKMYK